MNTTSDSTKRISESNLALYRCKLISRFCLFIACAFQFIPRLLPVFIGLMSNALSTKFLFMTFFFLIAMILIIAIEYIFYKKKGPKVIKYSFLVEFLLFLLFIGDWIAALLSTFARVLPTHPPALPVPALFGFTMFAWRAVMVTLIVQKWYLKVIPPISALIVSMVFALHYAPKNAVDIGLRVMGQTITLIIVFYCEDKLKWRMMWTNLQQEKWIQVNNFILNNIPENIMILNFGGEIKFISDYCKALMENYNFSLGNVTKDFFPKIHNLHQQQNELGIPVHSFSNRKIEPVLTTGHEILTENPSIKIETLEDLITNFKKISQTEDIQEREFFVYNGKLKIDSEERERSIEIKISFVQHFKNEYIILILRDTTQRDLVVMLEETNKYKDQLLASVSHELRTPQNGNLVESAINSKKVPGEIKETLLIPALRSSKFLLHLINDILDMSQIREKKLRLSFQPGDIKETIMSTVQLVELQAKKKGILFVLQSDLELPKRFCTDHIRLSQIILNLLNNAIKFTNEGGTVKLTADLGDDSSIKISVEDSGIGMTEESVKKLFSKYTHIEFEGRQKMNPTGVGLGLNIAYNLAELLAPEGQQGIIVESILNKGSTFTFIIENKERILMQPEDGDLSNLNDSNNASYQNINDERPGVLYPRILPKIHRNNTSASTLSLVGRRMESETIVESSSSSCCSCPKVLVVDDNPFNTMAFETILSLLNIKCHSVYRGSSAIKKLLSHKRCIDKNCKSYSMVFLDQEMPEMSGSDVVREIRRLQKENLVSPLVKIIGCTAHQSKEDIDRFLEAGLEMCIQKPISLKIIQDILKKSFLL